MSVIRITDAAEEALRRIMLLVEGQDVEPGKGRPAGEGREGYGAFVSKLIVDYAAGLTFASPVRVAGQVFNPDGTPMREGPSEPGDRALQRWLDVPDEDEVEEMPTAVLKNWPEDDPLYERATTEYLKRIGVVKT